MSKNIVVLISGNGSNLQAIIDGCESAQIDGKVVAVISNKPDVYGLERAKAHDIATNVLDHKTFDSREAYDHQLRQEIDNYQPDLVILAGFMRILTPEFVNSYQGRMINIHPSLLPKYQGLNTHQRAIDAGDDVHGVSVHFVTPELDGGPVILQAKVPIFAEDTVDELAARVHQQEHRIYPLVVNWFCESRLTTQLDDDSLAALLDDKVLGPQGHAAE